MKNIPPSLPHIDKDIILRKHNSNLKQIHRKTKNQDIIFLYGFPLLVSQILNAITCAQLALIFLRSLDHMGGRFSLSQGCNVTS